MFSPQYHVHLNNQQWAANQQMMYYPSMYQIPSQDHLQPHPAVSMGQQLSPAVPQMIYQQQMQVNKRRLSLYVRARAQADFCVRMHSSVFETAVLSACCSFSSGTNNCKWEPLLCFSLAHNSFCLPPKFCINYCCEMCLGGLHIPKSISQHWRLKNRELAIFEWCCLFASLS